MYARLLLLSVSAAGFPFVATVAAAQSSRDASKDDSTRTMPGVMPSFGLFAQGPRETIASARWNCIGVCTRASSAAALGFEGAPSRLTGREADALEFIAPGNGLRTPASAAAIDATARRSTPRSTSRSTPRGEEGTAEKLSEPVTGTTNGGTFEQAIASDERSSHTPLLLTAAGLGAGALYMANQRSGDDAPVQTGSPQPVDGPRPTLTMNGPVAQPANQVAAVPEPATWALLSVGLAALGATRRRRL